MKRARYTEEQIIGILQEHNAGAKCVDLCRKHGISEGTFYTWKSKFGGMMVSDAKRLWALEDENARLKKPLAEQMLDTAAMKELLAKVRMLCHRFEGHSNGRACRIAGADRKMVRYQSRRSPDTELRMRLRDLANEHHRFGHRRLFILPRREGEPSGLDRIYRLSRARRGWRCGGAEPSARLWAHERRSLWMHARTHAGRWTSCATSSPVAAGSAS